MNLSGIAKERIIIDWSNLPHVGSTINTTIIKWVRALVVYKNRPAARELITQTVEL